MRPLSKQEKEKILSQLLWDLDVDSDNMIRLLDQEPGEPENLDEINFYRRLLMSCDWYTLLKLVSKDKIKTILNDEVINRLYPEDLKRDSITLTKMHI